MTTIQISNAPWCKLCSFLKDVNKELADEDDCKVLIEKLFYNAAEKQEYEVKGFFEVLCWLMVMNKRQLLLRLNTFLKGAKVTCWNDSMGRLGVIFESELSGEKTVVYAIDVWDTASSPTTFPSLRDQKDAVHELWKNVLSGLDEENLNHVLPVVEGQTSKLADLVWAVETITNDKSEEEAEEIVNLLGKALPNGGEAGYLVAVWYQVGNPSNKMIVMNSRDTPNLLEIVPLGEGEEQQQATTTTTSTNSGKRTAKRKAPPTVEIDN